MSNVPTNLIPTRITGLPEYLGSSTLGYMPYIIDGRTYKVQFANIAAVGAVPSTREINTGSGLGGGGDLSANRTLFILPGGVDDSRLSVTGVVAGTYGAADSVPVLTINAQGRVTAATLAPIVLSNYVPTSRTITAGAGLTGGGDLSANRSFAVSFSSTTPEPLGPGSPGVSTVAARGDHVHPAVDLSDTTETQGVLPLSRGGTGNSLSPVAGAIVYSSNDKLYLTTAGSVGQVLRSGGPGGVPFWTNVGAGTVTSVAVATANGFAGTVADPTLSPVITLSTTVTGLIKGNGTAISAAVAGTDYVEPGAYTASGLTMATARLLGRTTASVGAAQEITVGNGLTLSSGSLVNAAPDQVVSLTGAGTTTVTGTYPSFTITSNDSTAGTVTSVNASGGTTGMSFTGGPITSAGTLTLNGTLAVANGGTGATDAVAALTNLGAYPASNPSGFTSNVGTVTSVSGTGTVSGLSLSGTVTSAGSLTLGGTLAVTPSDFASQTANTVLAAPNGSAGVPTFRAIVAADIPTLNQNTTGTAGNVSGIVAVANGGTGASVAATARTNLSAAASGANTDITSIALTTGTISTSPVNGTDIVNKAYADSIASGINFHQSVRLATAAALPANTYNNGTSGVGATLTATTDAPLVVDGVTVVVGNRILVKNEATQANNGVYVVTQVGDTGGGGPGPGGGDPYILTRATDFDSAGTGVDQIDAGDFFLVTAGSTLANTSWVQQTPLPITVGTTAIVFSQFAAPVLYSAGTGLSLTGTTFSITNTGVSASTYGSASSVPVIAVNAQGQITSASSSNIAIAASQITSGALAIANGGTGATDASGALSNLGAYPASNPSGFTSNTGTVTSVNLTAGTGVSVSGGPITASGSITVTNTAPDQVVSLTGSGATTVTGTYPNFTISSPTSGAGTVTSIDVSGGTTGLTTSGGPVTSSGTITLAGTLNVANGGTGATTLSSGYVLKGNGTSAVSASVIYDDGTNAMIGTTTALGRLTIQGNTNANLDAWIRNDNAGSSSRAGLVLNASGNSWRMGMGSTANNSNALTWNVDIGGANTEYMRLTTGGNLGLNTTTPVGRLSVVSGSSTGAATGAWSGNYSVFGPNAGSTTGAAIALGYNTSADAAEILALAPAVAWKPLNLYSAGLNLYASSGGIGASLNGSGTFSAVTDIRAPIFYDSANTAYYVDPASGSNLNGTLVNSGGTAMTGGWNRNMLLASTFPVIVFNSANVKYSAIGVDYTEAQSGMVFWVNGNSADITNGSATVALRINTGNFVVANDLRATIFYDSNNSAYYVDPASTSEFNTIQTRGGSGFRTFATPSASITSQLYFADASNTRAWNWQLDENNAAALWNYDGSSWQKRFTFTSGSNLTVGGAVTANQLYAQIFYDSQNGAYYVDPASTSNLNALTLASGSVLGAVIIFNNMNQSHGTYTDANLVGDFGFRYLQGATNGPGISGASQYYGMTLGLGAEYGFASYASQFYWPRQGTGGLPYPSVRFKEAGSWSAWSKIYAGWADAPSGSTFAATGDFRAPIFYDSNDTGYYVDPNTTATSFRGRGQIFLGPNTSDRYLRLGGDGGTSDHSTISTSNGNLHIDSQAGYSLYLNWYNSLPIWTEANIYAPLLYDRNDSAFYVNPNAGSRFQTIDVNDTIYSNNWFRSYGSSGWYNQSYGGGIFMQDTTWVRVYNGKAFYVPNEIAATGNITAYYSDERLKTKTGGIDNALEKLSGLSGFLYVENDLARSLGYSNDKQQVGVSAQAVQAVLPEAVSLAPVDFETLEDGTIISKSGENYLTVDYSRLVPLLIEAIKELENKVKALEAKE